jgi:hypothetical protein
MTTKSQEAFEALFKEVFPIQPHDWFEKDSLGYVSNSSNNGYKLYLATRKQALEEAVELANAWAMTHVIQDNANLTVGDYIVKELMK